MAVERIKYKFIPVEVPKPNYLLDKQLTNKELKNAWRVFEYSGIKNYQAEKENNGEPKPLIQPPPSLPAPNYQITNPIQSTNNHQDSESDHIVVNGNQIRINPGEVKHIKIKNSMKPSVIYQRKIDQNKQNYEEKSIAVDDEYEDLENNETIKDSIRNDLRDNLDYNFKNSYKDTLKDNIKKQIIMSKRNNNIKKIAKKMYHDDIIDDYYD